MRKGSVAVKMGDDVRGRANHRHDGLERLQFRTAPALRDLGEAGCYRAVRRPLQPRRQRLHQAAQVQAQYLPVRRRDHPPKSSVRYPRTSCRPSNCPRRASFRPTTSGSTSGSCCRTYRPTAPSGWCSGGPTTPSRWTLARVSSATSSLSTTAGGGSHPRGAQEPDAPPRADHALSDLSRTPPDLLGVQRPDLHGLPEPYPSPVRRPGYCLVP